MKIVGTCLLLLMMATSAMASIGLNKYMEIVLSEEINSPGNRYLTDIDGDGYLDILFDLDSKIGWYSGADAAIKSSISKKRDYDVSRSYVLGNFDGDGEPDYVEMVISGLPERDFLAVYYLSSHGFSGTDTIILTHITHTSYPDPFDPKGFHVVAPSVYDLNEDGIDELYTGYYYYHDICNIFFCYHRNKIISWYSYQYGDTEIGTQTAPPSGYQSFELAGYADPITLLIRNQRDFGEAHGIGAWDESPLEIVTMNGGYQLGKCLLESEALCLSTRLDGWSYSINMTSRQIIDARDGFGGPRLLLRVDVRTSGFDGSTYEYCMENQIELLELELSGTGTLPVNWRTISPDWATSDIIFADTRKPDHLFLSNKVRLYQVESATLQMIDYSNEADLAGRMVGYQPLSDGEEPTLLVLDGDQLKFFKFDFLIPTDVDDRPDGLPTDFVLSQNYPNPFNPSTEIAYSLPTGSHVKLTVYNSLGQEVKVLVDKFVSAGTHTVGWNATDKSGNPVASGVYFYRLNAGDISDSRKMLLLK